MDTANKGEWSELFVLASLLADGKLNIADEKLAILEGVFFEISKIITSAESQEKVIYEIQEGDISILDPESGKEKKINRSVIKNKITAFLHEVIHGRRNDRAFPTATGTEIKRLLKAKKLSATSQHKADLMIESYDPRVRRMTESGYSIKSQLGSASTLFNASQATNMTYEAKGLNENQIKIVNAESSCRNRVIKIYGLGGQLVFLQPKNNIFKRNLMMVDSYFPEILAEALTVFYLTETRTLEDCISKLNSKGIPGLKMEDTEFFLINNFKKFLFYSALGMVAKSIWDGMATATGGIILVKKNGEIVGYNPYDINLFQEYLLKNTKFDSPDSGRNKYGKIYKEGKKYLMNLNFQIRFLK